MIFRTKLVAGLSTLAMVGATAFAPALAQDQAPAPQMEAPTAAPNMDEEKLQSFAVAFLEVTKVTQAYQPQIESAASDEDRQQLQQQASEEMVNAVNGADGITVDEYNMIIQAAQTDPELAQKINTRITEAASDQPAQ